MYRYYESQPKAWAEYRCKAKQSEANLGVWGRDRPIWAILDVLKLGREESSKS